MEGVWDREQRRGPRWWLIVLAALASLAVGITIGAGITTARDALDRSQVGIWIDTAMHPALGGKSVHEDIVCIAVPNQRMWSCAPFVREGARIINSGVNERVRVEYNDAGEVVRIAPPHWPEG